MKKPVTNGRKFKVRALVMFLLCVNTQNLITDEWQTSFKVSVLLYFSLRFFVDFPNSLTV